MADKREPGVRKLWDRLQAQFDMPTREQWGVSPERQADQRVLADIARPEPVTRFEL